jgi:ribokinase
MRKSFRGAHIVLFQLETPIDTVAAALKLAREEGLQTMLDPAPARPLTRELLEQVDILTPNESEALLLLGLPAGRVALEDAPELASTLLDLGPRMVILKLGDQGCFMSQGASEGYYPAFTVEVRDSTAAGDTFNAALAVGLSERLPIDEAIPFANAAAAISVTRRGAQASAPTRVEVEAFIAEHRRSARQY